MEYRFQGAQIFQVWAPFLLKIGINTWFIQTGAFYLIPFKNLMNSESVDNTRVVSLSKVFL